MYKRQAVDGVQLPNWDGFMKLAAGCYELSGLGYIGVDMVLDQEKGPLILELNARPGLNIQIANDSGLVHRCHACLLYTSRPARRWHRGCCRASGDRCLR